MLVLDSQRGQFFIRDDHAAHHHDSSGNRGKIVFQAGQFLAAVHGLDEKWFEVPPGALRLSERKEPRLRFWGVVLSLFVVFVRHGMSVLYPPLISSLIRC